MQKSGKWCMFERLPLFYDSLSGHEITFKKLKRRYSVIQRFGSKNCYHCTP